jgi:hypothetical protein
MSAAVLIDGYFRSRLINAMNRILVLYFATLVLIPISSQGQGLPAEVKEKVESIINGAYQTATAKFPCKLKSKGSPKMLRRQDVDSCLNAASDRVDWDAISSQLQNLRQTNRIPWAELIAAVESSMAAHPLSYEKVFIVKDTKALLPLTNSLLKFLPPDSLQNAPVFLKSGEKVGTYSGVYTFERSGELAAANSYRLSIFQYTDSKGDLQAPAASNRLLLDRYGVPWKDAISQPGFRLTSERLLPNNTDHSNR